MIERKAEGEEIVLQPAEEPEPVPDLMAALEASVAAAKEDGGEKKGKKKPTRTRGSADGAGAKGGKAKRQRGSREKAKKS